MSADIKAREFLIAFKELGQKTTQAIQTVMEKSYVQSEGFSSSTPPTGPLIDKMNDAVREKFSRKYYLIGASADLPFKQLAGQNALSNKKTFGSCPLRI